MKRLCILLIIALLCLVTASPNLFSQTLAPAKTRVLIKNKQLKSENKKLNIELKKLKKELKQKELEIQKLNKKNLSLQKRNKLVLEKIVPFKQALNQLKTKNEKLIQKNKEFQTDAVSYVGLNTKLREEKQGFEQGLKKAQKVIETKEGELQRVTKELEGLKKKIVDDKKKQAMVIAQKLNQFQKEKKILKEEIDSLSKKLKKERGIYHYNLAIAYGQAKLYDEAIEAYKKSLTFEPDSPETYYNLGLIYENIKENPEEAIKHYLQYLEFNPNADDREEVEKWIERLKRFHL